jgi:hypothetical protein
MKRYWIIAPYDSTRTQIFEKVWEYDLRMGVIAIGWRELGDVSRMTDSDLKSRIMQVYGEKNLTLNFNSVWRFYHEITPGDVIIARRGTKKIAGIGTVTKTAFYDEGMGRERVANMTEDFYSNFIGVQWDGGKRDIGFERIVFSFQTIYEISGEKYHSLVEGKLPSEGEEGIEQPNEFILEKYLEDFIITNFDNIFKGKLELYKDPEGNIGQQYPTDIGSIDILAKDPTTNSYVVVELKKGRESDKVIGQILRYMGWVKENLCQEEQDVKGLIICKDQDTRLTFALKMTQNIEVNFYKVNFQLISNP